MKKTIKKRIMLTKTSSVLHERFTHLKNLTLQTLNIDSEYGYFKGTVENIAKDITVDQSTGNAYYLVKVKCGEMTLNGKDGKEASLKNGMACQAKIVVDEENVLTYLLKKIDLLD